MDELKPQPDLTTEMLAGYIPLLKELRSTKRHLTEAPTFTPQNFLEQIQFYDDEGGTERIYFYVNGNWKYITLT